MARLVEVGNPINPVMERKKQSIESGNAKLHEVASNHAARMATDPYYAAANENGFLKNAVAQAGGVAKGLYDIGPRQIMGKVKPGEVADYRAAMQGSLDAPGGSTGATLGYMGTAAPAFMLPGANTAAGAALISGTLGAMQPIGEGESRTKNAAVSALGGYAGNQLGKWAGSGLKDYTAKKTAQLAAEQSRKAGIDATRKAALEAGFKIPPATAKPSVWNRLKESVAGKAATQQAASENNMEVANRLARKAAGIPDDLPITEQTLADARKVISQPYQQARSILGDDPIDELIRLKEEANAAWKIQNRNPTLDGRQAAQGATKAFENMDNFVDRALTANGHPDLAQSIREARAALAKNYAVDQAMITGSGGIDPRAIGRMSQGGKPLSGELKVVGDFANNHPKLVQPEKVTGSPGVSKAMAISSAMLGGVGGTGGAVLGGPMGAGYGAALGASIPMVVPAAMEKYILSNAAQRALIPNYAVNPLLMGAAKALSNPAIQGPLGMAIPGLLSTYE